MAAAANLCAGFLCRGIFSIDQPAIKPGPFGRSMRTSSHAFLARFAKVRRFGSLTRSHNSIALTAAAESVFRMMYSSSNRLFELIRCKRLTNISDARCITITSASFGESILPRGKDKSIGFKVSEPRSILIPAPAVTLPIDASR